MMVGELEEVVVPEIRDNCTLSSFAMDIARSMQQRQVRVVSTVASETSAPDKLCYDS